MAQTQKIGSHATTITVDNEAMTNIIYHATAVVQFDSAKIILDSGGWRTVTTKTRMNQVANQYKLGYSVYQEKGNWFVSYRGQTIDFYDGMVLLRN